MDQAISDQTSDQPRQAGDDATKGWVLPDLAFSVRWR